jgi:hypothetical protein
MKRLNFAIGIAMFLMAFGVSVAHASEVYIVAPNTEQQRDIVFHIGYYPNETPQVLLVDPLFDALDAENPTCKGLEFVISNIQYDFR